MAGGTRPIDPEQGRYADGNEPGSRSTPPRTSLPRPRRGRDESGRGEGEFSVREDDVLRTLEVGHLGLDELLGGHPLGEAPRVVDLQLARPGGDHDHLVTDTLTLRGESD